MRLLFLVAFVASAGCSTATAAGPKGPVVLELFTSEGCSSCPPADALVAELAADPLVIALELHVDYWDDLGWKDPFSQAAFSERQARYSKALRQNGVYTPQLVVNGVSQAVGSNRGRIVELLASTPAPTQPVTVSASRDGDSVTVHAAAPGIAPGSADLLVALTESGLVTSVERGENAGRRMAHGAVVRRLEPVPPSGELRLALPAGAQTARLAAVALLQDRKTLQIVGVARAPL